MTDLQNNDPVLIAFDVETKDPNLLDLGPGVYREDGYVLGCALAYKHKDGSIESEYIHWAHPDDDPEEKMNRIGRLGSVLKTDIPKVAANAMYDLDWLVNGMGLEVKGRVHDVQWAEPLIDEYRNTYSLNSLAEKYLGDQKFEEEMDLWCKERNFKGKAVQHIWRMPSELAGKYARQDVELTIKILDKQLPVLKEQDLLDVYNMEISLMPLYLQMKKIGTRLDVDKRESSKGQILVELDRITKEIEADNGGELNAKSTKQLADLLDKLEIEYPRKEPTEKMLADGKTEGNPSITGSFLEGIDHPLVQKIARVKKLRFMAETSLTKVLGAHEINGRIHSTFNPLRGEKGTVSGRFSSSAPNLQNQSSRDPEQKNTIRSLFIPEKGHFWASLDWSQIEYRILAHYASGPGSEDVRANYRKDPKTDYHQYVMDLTGLARKPAKNCNFGYVYGMGIPTSMRHFGWDEDYATDTYHKYHDNIRFLKATMNAVGDAAVARGYIRTLLGRRSRLKDTNKSYVMLNRLIQGSAADVMKKSMLMAYEEGVFNVIHPHITVHDELDVSVPFTDEGCEALWKLKEIMETCVELRVPLASDLEVGFNWAEMDTIKTKTDLLGWVTENMI